MASQVKPLKVVFGDELAYLISLLRAKREPNHKVLVLLPSYIHVNNCQLALLKEIKTIQNVVFTTFDDLALGVLKESTGFSFDLLDAEVEREAVARALRETGQPDSISNDLREDPSFITYMTGTLFELRRNAKSVSTENCSLPDNLANDKSVEGLTAF